MVSKERRKRQCSTPMVLLKISQLVPKKIYFFVPHLLMIPKNKQSLTPSIKTSLSNVHDIYIYI